MKILQVNNFHYPRGGSDRYFIDLSKLLQEYGNEVSTFASKSQNDIDVKQLSATLVKGVDTSAMKGVRNLIDFHYSLNAKKSMTIKLNADKPDIAHLHIFYGQLTSSIIKPLVDAGVPIVQTLHEFKLVCPTSGLYSNGRYCERCQGKEYWRALLERCNQGKMSRTIISISEAYLSDMLGAKSSVDRFITVSEYQKEQIVKLGIPRENLTTVYHYAKPILNPPAGPGSYFLYAGRVREDKGIGLLLDAYARLSTSAKKLKIAGTGENIEKWYIKAKELGINNRVEWLGHVTGKKLDDLFSNCFALVNPSLLNETFGLSLLEALSFGRPVIAFDVGAFSEVVTNDVDGYLVDAGSVAALSDAMEALLLAPSQAHEMGCRGLSKVIRKFSQRHHYDAMMRIYEEEVHKR